VFGGYTPRVPSATGTSAPASAVRRRTPTQVRSRERVERILDAASQIVLEQGLEALSTREMARVADVPVASLYQYFSDKDAVLLAICERDMAEMDQQVATDLAALDDLSLPALVETAMGAFVKVYHRRPAFMQIWMRGRTNPAVHELGRRHNQRTADSLLTFAREAGLIDAGGLTDAQMAKVAELAVETGDRAFQLAFEEDPHGDRFLLDQAVRVVTGYLVGFAPAARTEAVR
jgi:AcrR family transcriptional regulator